MKPVSNQQTDAELFARFANGDETAFREVVNRYKNGLYIFLRRFLNHQDLIDDVFQETFLQVHQSADTFQIERRLRPWLYTIAANKARDLLRSRARKPAVQLTTLDEDTSVDQLWDNLMSHSETADDIFDREQQSLLVRKVVSQLPDHLRQIIILAYFNHLSYKEMAQTLDIPLGTVKSRLHSAVAHFAREFRELNNTEERNDNGR